MKDRMATPHGDRPEHGGVTASPICRRLFCIEEAADVAEKPVQEICRWIRSGKLKAYHLGGGRVRIDEVELAECISSPDSKRP
jgi:excisionase family DNA binding protein